MSTIRLIATAGRDSLLHLEIPALAGDYEVTIFLAAKPGVNGTHTPNDDPRDLNMELLKEEVFRTAVDRGWPEGYFEATMGSIDDETFVAPPRYR